MRVSQAIGFPKVMAYGWFIAVNDGYGMITGVQFSETNI